MEFVGASGDSKSRAMTIVVAGRWNEVCVRLGENCESERMREKLRTLLDVECKYR